MGVKSTVTITREEANELYAKLKLQANHDEKRLKFEASLMNTEELEDILEALDDMISGGESFRNYLISDN